MNPMIIIAITIDCSILNHGTIVILIYSTHLSCDPFILVMYDIHNTNATLKSLQFGHWSQRNLSFRGIFRITASQIADNRAGVKSYTYLYLFPIFYKCVNNVIIKRLLRVL